MNNRGVVYCATNQTIFLEAALISAIVFRHWNPTLPVTIFCDRETYQPLLFDEFGITGITLKQAPLPLDGSTFASRSLKTSLGALTPYQETLYLDSDILPLKSVDTIWDYLQQTEFAMVRDRMPTIADCDHIAQVERDYTLEVLPGHTPQFNNGVMLWRSNMQTRELFYQWNQEWQCFKKHDQLAMVRALATTGLAVTHMPVNYNISPIDAAPVLLPKNEVYFLHCWDGRVASGEYRQIARQFYPEIVDRVEKLLGSLINS